MEEARVMDLRRENMYVILVGKCEGRRQLGRSGMGRRAIL